MAFKKFHVDSDNLLGCVVCTLPLWVAVITVGLAIIDEYFGTSFYLMWFVGMFCLIILMGLVATLVTVVRAFLAGNVAGTMKFLGIVGLITAIGWIGMAVTAIYLQPHIQNDFLMFVLLLPWGFLGVVAPMHAILMLDKEFRDRRKIGDHRA